MAIRLGTPANDPLNGTVDDDDMYGLAGKDTIFGDAGDDLIIGGKGKDKLTGGPGADIFAFVFKSDLKPQNVDTIKDFTPGEDQILLSYDVFKGMGFGQLKEQYFHVGKHAADADDHIIFNPKNGKMSYDADGDGQKPQEVFLKMGDVTTDPTYFDGFLSAIDIAGLFGV